MSQTFEIDTESFAPAPADQAFDWPEIDLDDPALIRGLVIGLGGVFSGIFGALTALWLTPI